MAHMSLHPWVGWIESDANRQILLNAKDPLRIAWEQDQAHRRTYPINTSYALFQILDSLSWRSRKTDKKASLPEPKTPKSLAELIPEELVRAIWEEHHNGSLNAAIGKAAGLGCGQYEMSGKVFSQILKTMEIAYSVNRFGTDLLPRPKTNILHRGLQTIAKAAISEDDLDEKWFSELLDYLCPCPLKRHREAVRKLQSRSKEIG
jgi:hypothetical protein